MSGVPLTIVRFCAEEVGRQYAHRGADPERAANAVADMVDAWAYATDTKAAGDELSVRKIEFLGELIEPKKNRKGYRRVPVYVGDRQCPSPKELPRLVPRYVERLPDMTPEEAYREFEEIHPFVDGNGRCGKIIFNWLSDTLMDPKMPPNFWGIYNP